MAKADAARAEAAGAERVEFEWRGHHLSVPASADDLTVSTLEAFERGHQVAIARGVLGDQFAEIVGRADGPKKPRREMTRRDLDSLGDAIAEALGFGRAGE